MIGNGDKHMNTEYTIKKFRDWLLIETRILFLPQSLQQNENISKANNIILSCNLII